MPQVDTNGSPLHTSTPPPSVRPQGPGADPSNPPLMKRQRRDIEVFPATHAVGPSGLPDPRETLAEPAVAAPSGRPSLVFRASSRDQGALEMSLPHKQRSEQEIFESAADTLMEMQPSQARSNLLDALADAEVAYYADKADDPDTPKGSAKLKSDLKRPFPPLR